MCADPLALLLWLNAARDTLAPLWEGHCGAVLGAAARSAKLTQPLSLHSSGLVLVTDAIAGMGLAPGRHTLGQQVVEIDGLNTYIAGNCLWLNCWGQCCHSCLFLKTSAHLAVLISLRQHLCHPLGFWCLIALP